MALVRIFIAVVAACAVVGTMAELKFGKFNLEEELAMTHDFRNGRDRRAEPAADENMVLVENPLAVASMSKCLDGTTHKYYVDLHPGSTKWIILLEPGGVCFGPTDCIERANSSLGSSNFFSDSFKGLFTMSDDATINPDFHNWNKIFVPYCSGDAFTGTRAVPDANSWGLVFTGHRIVMSVVEDLYVNRGMSLATEIILSGQSAGGVGVFVNLDYVANRVSPIPIKGLSDSGWFHSFPSVYEDFTNTNPDNAAIVSPFRLLFNYVFMGVADEDCLATVSPADRGFCMLGWKAFPHIQTPLFLMAFRWDTYIMEVFALMPMPPQNTPFYNAYSVAAGNYQRSLVDLFAAGKPQNGLFFSDCWAHVYAHKIRIETFQYKVRGSRAYDAFSNWYFNRELSYKTRITDEIGANPDTCNDSCCNPTYCFGTCKATPDYTPNQIWGFEFEGWKQSFASWKAGNQCA
eukprot:Opistho-2@89252